MTSNICIKADDVFIISVI